MKPSTHGINRQIPDLVFSDIGGQKHKLSDSAGHKAVVFVMTGTGCPLCLKYAPTLAAIERKYRDRRVAFIFVNPNESERRERLEDAVRKHGFQGPYVHDGEKSLRDGDRKRATKLEKCARKGGVGKRPPSGVATLLVGGERRATAAARGFAARGFCGERGEHAEEHIPYLFAAPEIRSGIRKCQIVAGHDKRPSQAYGQNKRE